MRKKKKCVVILSGGIDSSTAAAVAKETGYSVHAISFDYGQRHSRELKSARAVAKSLGIKNHLFMRFDMGLIGSSALTSGMKIPKRKKLPPTAAAGKTITIPPTYVPARNTIFLSFALAWAESLQARDIFIGASSVDYSGYPDCRPEYLRAFERLARLATKAGAAEGGARFRVIAPLLHMTKGEIIKKGASLGLDYRLTWSCYDPATGGVPCGGCESCLFRAKGFREAGLRDPLLKAKRG